MVTVPRFVERPEELNALLDHLPLLPCPHCGRAGNLVGHGFLRGYDERSSEKVTRGRRILCSCRGRKRGCGKTVSTLLTCFVERCTALAATLWVLFSGLADGLSVERAAKEAKFPLDMRSAYRVAVRLKKQALTWRSWLSSRVAAPKSVSVHPRAQLREHLTLAAGPRPFESPEFRCDARLL